MTVAAIRRVLEKVPLRDAAHAGLVLNRYLRHAADGTTEAQDARRGLFEVAVASTSSAAPLYRLAYQRWEGSIGRRPHAFRGEFTTHSPLIVGLGGHHVLETGLTVHHTYGTPVIPGTALKGLTSSYCHEVWGGTDVRFSGRPGDEGEWYRVLFGTPDEGGLIEFHDAWITPGTLRGCLRNDVLTPHHSDSESEPHKEPTDFDMPIPTTFLSVTGTFLVALSAAATLTGPDGWLRLACSALAAALDDWGVGGKTSSGYGRLGLQAKADPAATSDGWIRSVSPSA